MNDVLLLLNPYLISPVVALEHVLGVIAVTKPEVLERGILARNGLLEMLAKRQRVELEARLGEHPNYLVDEHELGRGHRTRQEPKQLVRQLDVVLAVLTVLRKSLR
jgi:hypothetical protein